MLLRTHNAIPSAPLVLAVLLAAAAPTLAAVNMSGDVPQQGTTFGTITTDINGDQISDIIDDQGNNVFDNAVDPDNPAGGGGFLAWDDPLVWVDYSTNQNILVGQTGTGSLEINGGTALRYQYLVLGGVANNKLSGAASPFPNAELDLTTGPASNAFDFEMELTRTDLPTTGNGTVTVTGFGSIYNNDPNVIPGDFQVALDAAGYGQSAFMTPDASGRDPANTDPDAGYHAFVGLHGRGTLNIDTGGAVELQDALMVGVGGAANGTVNVTGPGSTLSAYGRTDFDGEESEAATRYASTIGGLGTGTLNITGGGSADFYNGLNMGFFPFASPPAGTSASRTGIVRVEGSLEGIGSILTVRSTSVTGTGLTELALSDVETVATTVAVSLAVGSPVGTPDDEMGAGNLTIAAGGTVNVQSATGYDVNKFATDANVAVGELGQINMEGGYLNSGNVVFNGGSVNGYGIINARTFYNGTFDTTTPLLNVPNVVASTLDGQVLTINVSGDSMATDPQGRLYNRGNMSGNLLVTATGRFENDGLLSANGSITSSHFYNGTAGRISIGEGDTLSIMSTSTTSEDARSARDNATGFAFQILDDSTVDGTVETGASIGFFQANLGSIIVDGGELNFGKSVPADPTMPADPNNSTDVVAFRAEAFRNARSVDASAGVLNENPVIGTIIGHDALLSFNSGLYNTGAISFTGGNNTISGIVENGGFDYDPGLAPADTVFFPGVITVSGDHTTLEFEDSVINRGVISIGPHDNVVTFLGDVTNFGTIKIASNLGSFGVSESAAIVVANDVTIVGGTIDFAFAMGGGGTPEVGASFALLTAGGDLDEQSLFTDLVLPTLPAGQYWDVIYDTENDEVRLEIIESAAFGADFTGDGFVDSFDIDVWTANVGITSGASIIQGDADLDGDVDLDDYLVLMEQVLIGTPFAVPAAATAGTVPEPSSFALALLALGAVRRRRRR